MFGSVFFKPTFPSSNLCLTYKVTYFLTSNSPFNEVFYKDRIPRSKFLISETFTSRSVMFSWEFCSFDYKNYKG